MWRVAELLHGGVQDEDGCETVCTGMRELNRWHSSSCLSEGQAAVELFFRLNHARQTVDFVRRQVSHFYCSDIFFAQKADHKCAQSACSPSLWRY